MCLNNDFLLLLLLLQRFLFFQSFVNSGWPQLVDPGLSEDEDYQDGGGQGDQGGHDSDPHLFWSQSYNPETKSSCRNCFWNDAVPRCKIAFNLYGFLLLFILLFDFYTKVDELLFQAVSSKYQQSL